MSKSDLDVKNAVEMTYLPSEDGERSTTNSFAASEVLVQDDDIDFDINDSIILSPVNNSIKSFKVNPHTYIHTYIMNV